MSIQLQRLSPISGKYNTLELPITADEFEACAEAYHKGALLQDAFPMLSAELREFVKTGITPDEWNAMFGSDD